MASLTNRTHKEDAKKEQIVERELDPPSPRLMHIEHYIHHEKHHHHRWTFITTMFCTTVITDHSESFAILLGEISKFEKMSF